MDMSTPFAGMIDGMAEDTAVPCTAHTRLRRSTRTHRRCHVR